MSVGRWLVYTVAAVLIGGAVYWNYLDTQADGNGANGRQTTTKVIVKKAELAEFVDRVESLGSLLANEAITIVSEETGLITDVLFEEGETVARDKILIKLDSREEEAELAAAEAKLDEARTQYDRLKDLAARNVATQARLDEQLVALRRAEADVRVAKARLTKRVIRAPFDGNLGIRRVSPGALVTQGLEITTLDDVSVLKLDFSIPETFIRGLAAGQDIEGRVSVYPGKLFRGKVSIIGSRVDPVTRTIEVRAFIPNPERILRPGMLMAVDLLSGERQGVKIPEEAVFPIEDKQYAYVVVDGIAQRREVTIGTRLSGSLEIRSGIEPGELVVIRGLQSIKDKAPVEAIVEGDLAAARKLPESRI